MTATHTSPQELAIRRERVAGRFPLHRVVHGLLPWLAPAVGVAIWQVSSDLGWVSARYVPSPLTVAKAGVRLASTGELARHVGISTGRAALGFAIGGGIGLATGIVQRVVEDGRAALRLDP